MATKRASAAASTRRKPGPPPGSGHKSAIVDFNFNETLETHQVGTPGGRTSQWDTVLEKLQEATIEGKVPLGSDGYPQFIKLAEYANVSGASTQLKELEKNAKRFPDANPDAFELRARNVTRDDRRISQIWGRYIG